MQDGKNQELLSSGAEPPAIGPMRNTLASVVLALESLPAWVTSRVSRLLGRLGYERRRRNTVPRSYHYVRSGAPLSHCPTSRQLISPARAIARVGS